MKKILLKPILFLAISLFSMGANAQYTAIPDPVFENVLRIWGYDDSNTNDGQVPNKLINTVESLDLRAVVITNLSGIKSFTSLKT